MWQDAVKVMAKSLVRNRHAVTKMYSLKSQLQAVSLRMAVSISATTSVVLMLAYIKPYACAPAVLMNALSVKIMVLSSMSALYCPDLVLLVLLPISASSNYNLQLTSQL